jgi:hypothetical protein
MMQLGMVACQEALVAALRGNYGVGALLVDPQGTIVARGQNAVFSPYFRSDLHAEMVVMNTFEERHPEIDTMHWVHAGQFDRAVSDVLRPSPGCGSADSEVSRRGRLGRHGQPTTASTARVATTGTTASNQPGGRVRSPETVRSGRLPRHSRRLPPKTVVALTQATRPLTCSVDSKSEGTKHRGPRCGFVLEGKPKLTCPRLGDVGR